MHRVDEQGAQRSRRRRPALISALVLAALALALPAGAFAATPEYKLTIGVVGHGAVQCKVGEASPGSCAAKYPEGTEVELIPVPEPSWEFEEWGGDCEGQPEECPLTFEEDESVTATFVFEPPEYLLDVDTFGGTGYGEVECRVGGGELELCGEYPEGTKVTLVVTEVEEGSKFVKWQGDCTGTGGCAVTMNGPRSVIAVFDLKEYLLSVEISGKGFGTVECETEEGPEECRSKYPWETEVDILPVPAPGSSFSVCKVDGVEKPLDKCAVEMTEPHSVVITFNLEPTPEYNLTISKNGTGTGTVKCKVNGGSATTCASKYTQGTSIELVQSANAGSEFAGWSGDCTGTGACSLTMNAAHSVTATFNAIPPAEEFTLTIEKSGSGSGSITSSPAGIDCGATCSATFPEGTEVTLTATAAVGSEFVKWDGCSSQPEPGKCKVTMSASKAATATFDPIPEKGEFVLTVKRGGTGSGTVASSPAGIDCGSTCMAKFSEGTAVTLSPTPDGGSQFKRWFGGGCDFQARCTTTMNGAKIVEAVFISTESTPTPEAKKGRVKVVKRVAPVRGGRALLALRCAGGPCRGRLKLVATVRMGRKTRQLVIGKLSFRLARGAGRTFRVRLTRRLAKRELARRGKLRTRVQGSGVVKSTLKLRKAKTRRKR